MIKFKVRITPNGKATIHSVSGVRENGECFKATNPYTDGHIIEERLVLSDVRDEEYINEQNKVNEQ